MVGFGEEGGACCGEYYGSVAEAGHVVQGGDDDGDVLEHVKGFDEIVQVELMIDEAPALEEE